MLDASRFTVRLFGGLRRSLDRTETALLVRCSFASRCRGLRRRSGLWGLRFGIGHDQRGGRNVHVFEPTFESHWGSIGDWDSAWNQRSPCQQ
jgi:hypothetical protein